MKKTLQEQYSLIKEGKGHRDVFMKQAKATFPNQFRNAATFDEIVNGLKHKNVIVENVVGTEPINQLPSTKKESYEIAFEKFLKESQEESEKAELKTTSKQVEEDLSKGFDTSDKSNPDNLIFDQVMKGYYTEMCEPKNKDKTMEQIKAIVFKNLEKNPIYYTEKGQFGIKDLGYTTEHPGLGTPKEPKGKYKSSGYGDLKENKSTESYKPIDVQVKEFFKKYNVTKVDKTPIPWKERHKDAHYPDFVDLETGDVSSWHIHNGIANPENQQSWDLAFGAKVEECN